jgi:hypothetical protein
MLIVKITTQHKGQSTMISDHTISPQIENIRSNENLAVSKFIRFLKHIGLKEMLAQIPDHRQDIKKVYSNDSLLLWALSVFFFRQESKNSLNTTILDLPTYKQNSLLNYLGIQECSLPKRDCVDDYLKSVDSEIINGLLMQIFHWAKQNKIFYNHAESLLPNNFFHLGIDGFWVHRYLKPHAVNKCGENICPYCLPRVHNKGKADEWTDWLHAFVTFVLIFPGGFQFPIYVYPLKASQVDTTASDEKLKQECELLGAYKVLPELRKKLGRIAVTVLLDSLYANEPMFMLLESLNLDFLVVRQDETFKSIGQKCNELDTSELYQKHYQDQEKRDLPGGKIMERRVKWYNNVACGKESSVNVLRFSEVTKNANGVVIKEFHTEWLGKTTINKRNWRSLMERGRMRGDHEDTHNSLKNRGFAAKHDYARTNPNLCLNWKLLMFVAMLIFELFSFTTIGKEAKGKRSWMKFARDLLQQLVEVNWEAICYSSVLRKAKIQFRYDFAPE